MEVRQVHADGEVYRWWPATVESVDGSEISLVWPRGTVYAVPTPRQTKIAELYLAVGPGQLKGARYALDSVIVVCQDESLLAGFGNRSREGHNHGCSRSDSDAQPQTKDRVKDCAGGAGQRRSALERHRVRGTPATAEKTCPVGLHLGAPDHRAFDSQNVYGP